MASSSLKELDEQLEELAKLKLSCGDKKAGPAVPPKPKKTPAVPKSYSVDGPSVPSYSSPLLISNSDKNTQVYSNLPQEIGSTLKGNTSNVIYSNLSQTTKPVIYSNVPPFPNSSTSIYSNIQTYSNVGIDDLPPPPPEPAEYSNIPGDFPPPPSPVSSSYSELRRATYQTNPPNHSNYNADYGVYGTSSQSSTYESIYEPICPRSPSQASNYSLYAPYVSGSQASKEKQVNALTDLLVQSMDGSPDEDILGVCEKCKEYVVNEGSGCVAMEKVYHITCFTCHQCKTQLQGKPFFALEGKPYCEQDYLNTLEKCSVCLKPILDRILRATGKPYHPQCFTCVVCGRSLDGIPFTVDAVNQIHCITDFHKKFAPRCCVCKLPIMPEQGEQETVRVVALDRSFHVSCYKCEDCGLVLSSEAQGRGCYPLDDHVLCKSCNAKRIQTLTLPPQTTDL
ncbi:hypothetical protein RUM44_000113 [Polyplax serrata]|uniref:LIM zinc-binding domain-containing protein n=1 Tax=Polyplax serrata TaxID=468196 RepID=A0ABR1B4I3_POLSC